MKNNYWFSSFKRSILELMFLHPFLIWLNTVTTMAISTYFIGIRRLTEVTGSMPPEDTRTQLWSTVIIPMVDKIYCLCVFINYKMSQEGVYSHIYVVFTKLFLVTWNMVLWLIYYTNLESKKYWHVSRDAYVTDLTVPPRLKMSSAEKGYY